MTWDGVADLQPRPRARRERLTFFARPRWWLLGVVLLLHALFVLVVYQALQVSAPLPRQPPSALQARFVPLLLTPSPAVAPPPVSLPDRRPPPHASPAHTAHAVHTAPSAQVSAAPAMTLYDHDGQIALPAHAASVGPTPDYVQRLPQGDPRIMHNVDPVPYHATRFEKYFPPPDESAGGALVRRVTQALIKSKDVDLPHGVHLKCKTVLGIPTPNCAMPPAPPSAKDGDERLSMAPAQPLATDPRAAPPPSVAACIAMYRAGKPLASGCPTDTPNRAVDDELRQRAAGANAGR